MTTLEVDSVYMCPLENALQHHTDFYEVVHRDPPTAVLRRGQPFIIVLKFQNRCYLEKSDIVRLIFNYGTRHNTRLPISDIGIAILQPNAIPTDDIHSWSVSIKNLDPDALTLEVRSPVTTPAGIWRLTVETSLVAQNGLDKQIYEYPEFIYFLFNPWVKDDTVYMPEQRLLDEYVLNDVGKIWVGPISSSRGREWIFGQFDSVVLPAVMLVLERTRLSTRSKGDPVMLTRAISRLVNANDDDFGVLQGNWSGDYEGGTPPSAWTGSVPILQKYLDTRSEVLYGQCWVFAGVTTTICRALGIPSRVVTNVVSAHDANKSLSIDTYFGEDNEEVIFDPNNPDDGKDSIWNYHVWNDVWMARPDLPSGYGGWQAIDGTPQETSDSLLQCGPASLEAIRRGEVGHNYDTAFMVASVNADVIKWKADSKSPIGYSKIECNNYKIGQVILTKQPYSFDPNGDQDKQVITEQYKPLEATQEERLTFYNAVRGTERAKRFYDIPDAAISDVKFELIDIDTINMGESFSVAVKLENLSDKVRTVEMSLSAKSVYYNGIQAREVKKGTGTFTLQPKKGDQLKMTVKPMEYMDKLVEYYMLKIHAIGTVRETNQTWAGEDDFRVITPNLTITVADDVKLGESTTVVFQFTNPLKKKLTKCKLMYDGPGLTKSTTIDYRDVASGGVFKVEARFTPIRSGNLKLVGVFSSKELHDISGSADVFVTE